MFSFLFITLLISLTLNDLLLPGFPIINIGILVFTPTNKENKFSNKALFLAIPLSNSRLSAIKFSSNSGKNKKLTSKLLFLQTFINLCLNSSNFGLNNSSNFCDKFFLVAPLFSSS